MSKPLPFTEASLARAIKAVKRAGLHVIGVRPDGTVITSDHPIEVTSLIPQDGHNESVPSKWEDQRG
ncbi:hypothetical protein [Bradyrhizobium septentrionale]|uniref:Uncharacterized protein n=1 Tax=Bradyrhizobium septentrionale TaxID=1404411 RepID=A0ABZ2P8C5_9BRAD